MLAQQSAHVRVKFRVAKVPGPSTSPYHLRALLYFQKSGTSTEFSLR